MSEAYYVSRCACLVRRELVRLLALLRYIVYEAFRVPVLACLVVYKALGLLALA